jgi:hypothetical protein
MELRWVTSMKTAGSGSARWSLSIRATANPQNCAGLVSPDDRSFYGTNFGYSNISSFHLDGGEISVAKDPACPKVRGDGTARGLCGDITSGPSDNWITPVGAFLYQIYGNASRLVGYATQSDGSLNEVTSVKIPYNSPQGLAGF